MENYRDLFSLPDDVHFINCAYTSPLSKRVEAAAEKALIAKRYPANLGVDDFFEPADQVRSLFSRILGNNTPDRVAIIPSTSYGFATLTTNMTASPGQKVVIIEEQFPSSVYSWRRFARRTGCDIDTIRRPTGPSASREWNSRLLESLTTSTVAVSIPHIHWTDGTLFDLPAIGKRARDVGAKFIIDGTQSVGALDLGFDDAQPDAVICAGYKWLTGSMGMGAAYYGPAFADGIPLEENWIARRNSREFSGLVNYTDSYADGAVRFDVGERGIGLLLPMFVEALQQVHEWGTDLIQSHCRMLTADAFEELTSLGFAVPDENKARHLFGVRLPANANREKLIDEMQARKISVSLRSDAVRVSPHLYNSKQDIEALLDAFRASLVK